MDKFYTVEEVAKMLIVNTNTIRIWLKNGTLKGLKICRYWRIKETDLQAFITKQEGETNNG